MRVVYRKKYVCQRIKKEMEQFSVSTNADWAQLVQKLEKEFLYLNVFTGEDESDVEVYKDPFSWWMNSPEEDLRPLPVQEYRDKAMAYFVQTNLPFIESNLLNTATAPDMNFSSDQVFYKHPKVPIIISLFTTFKSKVYTGQTTTPFHLFEDMSLIGGAIVRKPRVSYPRKKADAKDVFLAVCNNLCMATLFLVAETEHKYFKNTKLCQSLSSFLQTVCGRASQTLLGSLTPLVKTGPYTMTTKVGFENKYGDMVNLLNNCNKFHLQLYTAQYMLKELQPLKSSPPYFCQPVLERSRFQNFPSGVSWLKIVYLINKLTNLLLTREIAVSNKSRSIILMEALTRVVGWKTALVFGRKQNPYILIAKQSATSLKDQLVIMDNLLKKVGRCEKGIVFPNVTKPMNDFCKAFQAFYVRAFMKFPQSFNFWEREILFELYKVVTLYLYDLQFYIGFDIKTGSNRDEGVKLLGDPTLERQLIQQSVMNNYKMTVVGSSPLNNEEESVLLTFLNDYYMSLVGTDVSSKEIRALVDKKRKELEEKKGLFKRSFDALVDFLSYTFSYLGDTIRNAFSWLWKQLKGIVYLVYPLSTVKRWIADYYKWFKNKPLDDDGNPPTSPTEVQPLNSEQQTTLQKLLKTIGKTRDDIGKTEQELRTVQATAEKEFLNKILRTRYSRELRDWYNRNEEERKELEETDNFKKKVQMLRNDLQSKPVDYLPELFRELIERVPKVDLPAPPAPAPAPAPGDGGLGGDVGVGVGDVGGDGGDVGVGVGDVGGDVGGGLGGDVGGDGGLGDGDVGDGLDDVGPLGDDEPAVEEGPDNTLTNIADWDNMKLVLVDLLRRKKHLLQSKVDRYRYLSTNNEGIVNPVTCNTAAAQGVLNINSFPGPVPKTKDECKRVSEQVSQSNFSFSDITPNFYFKVGSTFTMKEALENLKPFYAPYAKFWGPMANIVDTRAGQLSTALQQVASNIIVNNRPPVVFYFIMKRNTTDVPMHYFYPIPSRIGLKPLYVAVEWTRGKPPKFLAALPVTRAVTSDAAAIASVGLTK